MKKEYDFSKGEKGKFYYKTDEIKIPIYLDKKVNDFYLKAAHNKKVDLSSMINSILKKEIEIHREIENNN